MSTNDIRSIAPEARNCYFEDEQELTFYEKYTFINCRLECAINEVEKNLSCVPWYLPKVSDILSNKAKCCSQKNNAQTCDPWTAREFEVQMAVVQSKSTSNCSYCLPDCNHIAYSTSTTSAEFRYVQKCQFKGEVRQNKIGPKSLLDSN